MGIGRVCSGILTSDVRWLKATNKQNQFARREILGGLFSPHALRLFFGFADVLLYRAGSANSAVLKANLLTAVYETRRI